MHSTTTSQEGLLARLLDLAQRLYRETDGYLDHPEDPQLWYNRGYANGMLDALSALGHADAVRARLQPDAPAVVAGHEALGWGKAYRHGHDVGARETHEVLGLGAQVP